VPTRKPELLATSFGALLNELVRCPLTVLSSVKRLLTAALALDTGSPLDVDEDAGIHPSEFNKHTQIILYVARLGARVESYLSFLEDHLTGKLRTTSIFFLSKSRIKVKFKLVLDQAAKRVSTTLCEKLVSLFQT